MPHALTTDVAPPPSRSTVFLPLGAITGGWADGDEIGWFNEFSYLAENDGEHLAELEADIRANGVRDPLLLGNDGRVWDGHHRILVAYRVGLPGLECDLVPAGTTAPERPAPRPSPAPTSSRTAWWATCDVCLTNVLVYPHPEREDDIPDKDEWERFADDCPVCDGPLEWGGADPAHEHLKSYPTGR